MSFPSVTTACPACARRFDVRVPPGPDPRALWWTPPAEVEAECPCCGWEFRADAEDGFVTDGGEPDDEPLFDVDAEGELAAETVLAVTCTRCGRVHETDGPGVTPCPYCRRLLDVDERGLVNDGTVVSFECSRCGSLVEGSSAAASLRCGACGCATGALCLDVDHEDEGDDEGEEYGGYCEVCGYDYGGEDGGPAADRGGRRPCPVCDAPFFAAGEIGPAAPGVPADRRPDEWPVRVVAADGSGDFTDLAEAVACSPWQEVVLRVRPGEYRGSVAVNRPLAIVADGPPGSVRLVADRGPALVVACNACEIRGLAVECREGVAALVEVSPWSAGPSLARPLLEGCTFTGGGPAAVRVRCVTFGPVLRNCRATGTAGVGVLVEDRAWAALEACTVAGCAAAGVESAGGGRAQLTGCELRDNGGEGVRVRPDGEVLLADCVLSGNAATGVAVSEGHVRLVRCRVAGGRSGGVRVRGGVVVLDGCEVRGNARCGVTLRRGARAVLLGCRVAENGAHGLRLSGRSRVLADGGELAANGGYGASVRGRGRLHLLGCRVRGNGATLGIGTHGLAGLERCDLSGNGRGGDVAPGGLILFQPPSAPVTSAPGVEFALS